MLKIASICVALILAAAAFSSYAEAQQRDGGGGGARMGGHGDGRPNIHTHACRYRGYKYGWPYPYGASGQAHTHIGTVGPTAARARARRHWGGRTTMGTTPLSRDQISGETAARRSFCVRRLIPECSLMHNIEREGESRL